MGMSEIPDSTCVEVPGSGGKVVLLKNLVKSPFVSVGDYTYYTDTEDPSNFETSNVLYNFGPARLIIGKFCAIATGAQFLMPMANHPTMGVSTFPFFVFGGDWTKRTMDVLASMAGQDTVIGNDVWIGREAVIMPGVKVGDGAIISTRAFVSTDVPAYSVVAGNPARLIKRRYEPEEIELLERLAWWDWPIEVITEHVRDILTGTPDQLLQIAKDHGLSGN
jgi:virginiamycin A acetyltransferase